MQCAAMLLCLALGAIVAEASILKEKRRISPDLRPESSKEFLKDLSGDKRPKVDILHFKHPYPVVQDSEDFDKDFIKDQNTDNGEWKAQSEYDRLRHLVAELKKKAAADLEIKGEKKKELEAAMKKHDIDLAKDKEDIGRKSGEVAEPLPPLKPLEPVKPVKHEVAETVKVEKRKEAKVVTKVTEEASSWWPSLSWPFSWPGAQPKEAKPAKATKAPAPTTEAPTTAKPRVKPTAGPKPTLAPVDLAAAEAAVEQAKQNLKGCQKELSVAKAQLKKLVDDLEQAKLQQVEAKEKLTEAKTKQAAAEKHGETLHSEYSKEAKEYDEAEAAYLKQKAVVESLRAQLLGAAKKVEAMRAAEDKDGGVYPVPHERSAAVSTSASQVLALIFTVASIRLA